MGAVRGVLGTSREKQAVPRAGLQSQPPTFPWGQGVSLPLVLFATVFSSEENWGLRVLRSSKQPICPQIKLLFGAFLRNHGSALRALGSCTQAASSPVKILFCGKGNVLSEQIPRGRTLQQLHLTLKES